MKNLILSAFLMFLFALSANVFAQGIMPAGASDRNLEDRNVKNRSNEIERVKRENAEADKNKKEPDQAAQVKFTEVKEDFEKIQMLQNEIIAAYSKEKQINYAKISTDAEQINKSGTRLKGNLFTPPVEENKDSKDKNKSKDKKKETAASAPVEAKPEQPLPTDIRSLIVEMDNTLAAFVNNQMFTNPQNVNPVENAKAQADLERLIKLSAALKTESDKNLTTGK